MTLWIGIGLTCSAVSGCFSTPPQIVQLFPNRGAVGVPTTVAITVDFDRPVATMSVASRFSVNPAIPGCDVTAAFGAGPLAPCRIVWINGDTGFTLLHPRAYMRPKHTYTFTLASGITDPSGVVNSLDHEWSMTTSPAPVITSFQPADGSTDVPVDTTIAVSFSTNMAAATEGSINLSPPVPGTQVVRNRIDPSRFVLLPGSLLESGVTYTLSVAASAADAYHQTLTAGEAVRFTTAGLSPVPHVVVLAAAAGERASTITLSRLGPTELGETISSEAALVAPRCPRAHCGVALGGAPLYTFDAAVLSPGGHWLAVVEEDGTAPYPQPFLVVLDPASRSVIASFADSSMPSWSPDGATLAFSRGGAVSFLEPLVGKVTSLPSGDPLIAPPVWSPLGETLVLPVASPTGLEHLELADSVVLARNVLPGLVGAATDPVISPDGSQLAFVRSASPGTWLASLGTAPAAPRLLDASLVPVGFTAPGLLICTTRLTSETASLVVVSVVGDDQIPILPGSTIAALGTVVVVPSGRQILYLSADSAGTTQAYVANADGTNATAVTDYAPHTLVAVAITVSA